MSDTVTLVWFRSLLRLEDHAALSEAAKAGRVVCLFVLDDDRALPWARGGASRWWLHHSLRSLADDIAKRGARLILRSGDTIDQVLDVAAKAKASAVHVTRAYEPWAAKTETELKQRLEQREISCRRFRGALLMEPEDIRTQSGDVYKVYTPFWRQLSSSLEIRNAIPAPDKLSPAGAEIASDHLEDWKLLPSRPDWAKGWSALWSPGEAGAHKRLGAFLDDGIDGYAENRDRPGMAGTSRLSPHLHFGEISPHAVWRALASRAGSVTNLDKDREAFLKELVWREFSAHLLFHFPHLPDSAYKPGFNDFPWKPDDKALRAWQTGQTGYPIVDAGMRELWQTGFMHNRVRMITASFLIKHLLIPWQTGEAWFWDTLVDADLANNSAGWQWVAGSGADASPYFRIFNPMTQAAKFDPDGDYIRRWVPELAKLPNKHLFAPFEAGADVLRKAGVTLGETYPEPIVEHKAAREQALAGYEKIK